ncbi:beta-galactosidase [Iodidimonas nitroreducens]|uniref:Beta-galactosidase n=1 Tax=Iodidimonas nitroreducens TaxID=1236968 RepID=A0A5A7N9H3_9PROT|nr:beta-galactosidase [Iodidimonas nitroreducens]GAK33162.1 beta-galactosidase [alpha proteobacterium Q-1]GER04265.1 beta-galactosidase [Iodidimonas nitroreducens]
MLGVCYYPEHWSPALWPDDARRMADLGLKMVRIGEFAWSRLEPKPGAWQIDWLDQAIETLANAGLKIVIGTPTATPPKWLIDAHPDILPVDPHTGRVRGFGSRRHYDFSSRLYRDLAAGISEKLARHYGGHKAVIGWQTDNELCCHETALSISPQAVVAFRDWCRARYGTIAALNEAWGNVFWSMEYNDFSEIEAPYGAVTETAPAHRLAFRRFTSDQVALWHRAMIAAIRPHAGDQFITHNFIPMAETGVDNFALARGLDFASYDNYPLGRTDLVLADAGAEEFQRFMRTGHPDLGAWTFDQSRCLTPSRQFWVMEQQPGPVNWARHNPRPASGMVRLWTLEAFAHGATCVSYFRWRQAPFAQEQMHAGLLRPDHSEAEAWPEIKAVEAEIRQLKLADLPAPKPKIAMIVSAPSQWVTEIERQGDSYDHESLMRQYYTAFRSLGLDVDIVSTEDDLTGYRLICAPVLSIISEAEVEALQKSGATLVFGPRSGGKTADCAIPEGLAPGALRALLPIRILMAETLRPGCGGSLLWQGKHYSARAWRDHVDPGPAECLARFDDGSPALVQSGQAYYLAGLTDAPFLRDFFRHLCALPGLDLPTLDLPDDLRISRRGGLVFAFNYAAKAQPAPAPDGADFVLGSAMIPAHDVAIWKDI